MRGLLRWIRVHQSALAALLLAALATGPVVLPHADPLGDAACTPAVEHDAGAHGIAAAGSTHASHDQHCLVCHVVRSFSCLLRAVSHHDRTAEAVERLQLTHARPAATDRWALVPGRAPPA